MATLPKTIHFISGVPRSGTALLANILQQNPRFDLTAPPGLLSLLASVRATWDGHFAFAPDEQGKVDVMRGMLEDFHAGGPAPVVFDRSTGWLAFLEMVELLLGRKVRVLVPVRDVREVLASIERMWRRTTPTLTWPLQKKFPAEFETIRGRCGVWLRNDQPVGLACLRITDALVRGFRDRIHFVRFEELTERPRDTLQAIYRFLGEDWFEHDFQRVKQVVWEPPIVDGLAVEPIRSRVQAAPPQATAVLGAVADEVKGPYPWDDPIGR